MRRLFIRLTNHSSTFKDISGRNPITLLRFDLDSGGTFNFPTNGTQINQVVLQRSEPQTVSVKSKMGTRGLNSRGCVGTQHAD